MSYLTKCVMLKPTNLQRISGCLSSKLLNNGSRQFASKSEKDSESEFVEDKPLKYLQSPAAQWKAQYSTAGMKDDTPEIERWSVLFSIAITLLYFCVLREENDVDERLKQPLFETVPGLEQHHLIAVYKYNSENSIDNREIENRMRELGIDIETIKKQK